MADLKKPSVKSKVEAVLFSTGHRITLDEISKLCRSIKEDVLAALQELKKEYDDKQSSLMLVEEEEFWKFAVRDHFIPMIRKIVTETELTKSVMETLAVIAFKYPILQSDLIKIRTNKAYDHLVELEKSGYITRQKHGRTNLIKLTEKFFRYFDLTEEKLKDQFKDFDSIAKAIKQKEEEVDKIKEEQQKKAEDLKKEDDRIKQEIESLDKSGEDFEVPLESYQAKPKGIVSQELVEEGNLIVEKEKLGEMEVIEESQKVKPKKDNIQEKENIIQNIQQPIIENKSQIPEKYEVEREPANVLAGSSAQIWESKEKTQVQQQHPKQKRKSEGIKLTHEMEAKVNQKVEEILHSGNQNKEEKKDF